MQIKIAICQIQIVQGQIKTNFDNILEHIKKAKKQRVHMIVFPELCLSGKDIGLLQEYEWFYDECEYYAKKIIQQSKGIAIVFGTFFDKKSATYIAHDKQLEILEKTHIELAAGKNTEKPAFSVRLSSVIYSLEQKPPKYALPTIHVNNVGTGNLDKNIYTYSGQSSVYNKKGVQILQLPSFEQAMQIATYDITKKDFVTKDIIVVDNNKHFSAIIKATSDFLQTCNIKKMVVGLSGGIDSAVSACLFTHILGSENVLCINMPSKYNSSLTINLAKQLAQNLNTPFNQIPVEQSIALTIKQINNIQIQQKNLSLSDFALENVQARDRSSRIIAAAASAFDASFSCNANKSEIAVGYGTFYGDLAGAICPLGDLWKHQVYEFGNYFNKTIFQKQIIPQEIFDIKPSAELSPSQTVGTGGDPIIYPYHDYLFKAFVEQNMSPLEIATLYKKNKLEQNIGCEVGLVAKLFPTSQEFFADLEKWWAAYNGLAIAKRIQAPPIISITKRPFGTFSQTQNIKLLPRKYFTLKQH